MTTVINLFAGPGAGKSTLSAEIYVKMKKAGIECELVREYVKDWAWEGRSISGFDQFYVVGKQIRKESLLYDKVDYIITDCPLWNSAFYEEHYEGTKYMRDSITAFTSYAENHGVKFVNFMLKRDCPYSEKGRYQTEEESKQIDIEMEEMLVDIGLEYTMLDMPNDDRADYVLKVLGV